jgi:hypothetical protein
VGGWRRGFAFGYAVASEGASREEVQTTKNTKYTKGFGSDADGRRNRVEVPAFGHDEDAPAVASLGPEFADQPLFPGVVIAPAVITLGLHD